jgi:Leucine-rich repeat (LRR) protein
MQAPKIMGVAVLTYLHTFITGELAKLELLSLSYNFLSSLPPTLPNLSFLSGASDQGQITNN